MKESNTVFRVQKVPSKFVVLDKSFLFNEGLSYKAKGMLALMLSMPDDWSFYQGWLGKQSTDGVTAVRTGLEELEEAGYLVRRQLKDHTGKFVGIEFLVYETPQKTALQENHTDMRFPDSGFPDIGKPNTTKNDSTKNEVTKNFNMSESPTAHPTSASTSIPDEYYDSFVGEYNKHRGRLPLVREISDKRKTKIRSVLKEFGKEKALSLVHDATLFVCDNDYWAKNRYNLDNLLNGTHLVEKAEKYRATQVSKNRDTEAPF